MLGKITHGFLGQGDIIVEKFYELPIQLDVDYGEIIIENKIEREIEIVIETLGGGGDNR